MAPDVHPNGPVSDHPDDHGEPTAYRSFEDMYYGNRRKPEPLNRRATDQEPTPNGTAQAADSQSAPRVPENGSAPTYPPMLFKLHDSLSDTWSNILVGSEEEIKTLLICGAARKEGATFISYYLSMFLAKEYSMKVLYVDTNVNHRPIPNIQHLPGLYSCVTERDKLASLILKTKYPGLYLLPSGAGIVSGKAGSSVLTRETIEYLLTFCRNNFDITVLDGQPITASPIMIEFAKKVDMALLVCRYGVSRQEVSKLAVDKLINCKARSVGVVLNDRQLPIPQMLYRLMG
ncbi:MAG: hypothetical protein AB1558_02085 [Thermodesulfobacteriota bacterium]